MSTPATRVNVRGCRRGGSWVAPIVLIVAGILLLLSEFDIVYFHKTWPLLLIIGGVLVLARRLGQQNGYDSEVNHG